MSVSCGNNMVLMTYDNCSNCILFEDWGEASEGHTSRIVYPQVRSNAASDYPEAVRENYVEAQRSLFVQNYKSCVVMTRIALQAATRDKQAKGKNLRDEIDNLAATHVIPDALRDWAHEIRDGGNLVAHPEPDKRVEKEDAEELLSLTESILEYLYVVPAHVERCRQRRNPQSGPAATP
jgi:hypothetical protein